MQRRGAAVLASIGVRVDVGLRQFQGRLHLVTYLPADGQTSALALPSWPHLPALQETQERLPPPSRRAPPPTITLLLSSTHNAARPPSQSFPCYSTGSNVPRTTHERSILGPGAHVSRLPQGAPLLVSCLELSEGDTLSGREEVDAGRVSEGLGETAR